MRSGSQLSLGERAVDKMRNAMGSWLFVFTFFAVMIAWARTNTVLQEHILRHRAFDPCPYILLNLFLSMMAGVQAAALLIAAKRADSIASEVAIRTENTEMTEAIKRNTDLLDENPSANSVGEGVGPMMLLCLSSRQMFAEPGLVDRNEFLVVLEPSLDP